MKPLVEIRRVGRQCYTYAVGTGGVLPAPPPESVFGALEFSSLESCLGDAGDALVPYFARVDLQLDGRYLGSCATTHLRDAPERLAQRIRQAQALAA